MHSSRYRILRRIFHFLHFYVRPLLLALIALFLAAAFYMLTVNFRLLRSSPKGVQPVIRISALDWIQARALGRGAKASEAKNDFAAAKMSWQLATRNDPGNPKWQRGWLANIMHEKPSWRLGIDVGAYSYHLLQLSLTNRPTNRADFMLVANALEHCRLYSSVWDLFEFEKDFVSPEEKSPLLRSLFHLGDYKGFRDSWLNLQLQTPDWMENPLMKLYHLGNQAILENDPSSRDALNQAVSAVSPSSPHYAQAQRVALRVAVERSDIPAGRQILEDLRQRQEATLPDTLWFWRLLIAKGEPKGIEQDIENSGDPVTEQESLALLQLLADADLAEETLKTFKKIIDQIGDESPQLWFAYGDWLIRQEKWPLLRDLARQTFGITRIEPIAFYWQGLIERERERHEQAQRQFSKIVDFMPSTPQSDSIRFGLAIRLLGLGQHETADQLMKEVDGETNESRDYWNQRVEQVRSQRDLKAFSQAAQTAYESDPEFDLHIYNYLFALLEEQKEPELTLSLSDKLIQRKPDDIPFQLLRARALRLNEKHGEADALTKQIDDVRAAWNQRVEQALSQGDMKAFFQAAQDAYQSDPEFDPHIYNYLFALLEEQREPLLTLFLSGKLTQQRPDFIPFQLLRARALRLNEKHEEADALAKKIDDVRAERIQRVGQAHSQRDWQAFSQAAQDAYDSDPEFVPHIHNYVVTLLQGRKEPELTLSLSAQLIQGQPDNPIFRLNRAHALLQSEKYEEAEAILKNISLTEEAAETPLAGDYNMALFKLAVGKGQSEEALRLYKTLNLENYMPETAQWVEKTISEISQAGGGGGAERGKKTKRKRRGGGGGGGSRNWKQQGEETGVHGGGS